MRVEIPQDFCEITKQKEITTIIKIFELGFLTEKDFKEILKGESEK